ncbi:esterase/lipase family protein [Pseudaquabacterium pictum]|uniref:Alpha/beta hydrolase n=1 Tax=Pseudaquabacterium pictum TaxID=2315236 RepID=A0A480AYX0_9BURK|nr:alpha/beta hydrolase [Rubrivivax pictus]GCL64905.1 alpha/beta hydrolase [Rubrivivax pictus]
MLSIQSIPRPSLTLLGAEPLRAAVEDVSHRAFTPARCPVAGDGHPVVIFPGLGTDGHAVAPLRRHCESLGYAALDWGRGLNRGPQGDPEAWLADLQAHVTDLLGGFEQHATFIGWKLGGICARGLAKSLRPLVCQVITLGTPFDAGAGHTHAGWIFRLLGGAAPPLTAAWSTRLRSAPGLPTMSIYSRTDGVVAWQACRHAVESDRVQDIEVSGSHIGLGWNRAVLGIVGDRLAQVPAQWKRSAAEAGDDTRR